MSGSETVNSPDEKLLAFDYVAGVLRGAEREEFLQHLRRSDSLQAQVAFWEEQLMSMSEPTLRKPNPEVWYGIEAKIQADTNSASAAPVRMLAWLWPSVSACASLLLGVCVWLLLMRDPLLQPNADYVAVLTDTQGTPQLTVLTATGGQHLWLKWESLTIAEQKNAQLWAISKRDGQARPLKVFAQTGEAELPLTEAHWRLIKDAAELILTEEDVGGSPLDEPSEILLAKGACVLLARADKAI